MGLEATEGGHKETGGCTGECTRGWRGCTRGLGVRRGMHKGVGKMHKRFEGAQGVAGMHKGMHKGLEGWTRGSGGMHEGFRGCTRGSGGAGWGSAPPGILAWGPVPAGGAAPLPQAEERTAAPGGEEPRRGPATPLHRCGEARSRDPRSSFSRPRAAAAER